MREIIRPEILWRDAIPLTVLALIVLLVFVIVYASMDNVNDMLEAEAAVSWTRHAMGALIAIVSAFGLFWRALNGEPLELQFGFALALFAGLLLVDIHWSLAIAMAAIGLALIIRTIMLRGYPTSTTDYSAPVNP